MYHCYSPQQHLEDPLNGDGGSGDGDGGSGDCDGGDCDGGGGDGDGGNGELKYNRASQLKQFNITRRLLL